MDNILQNCAQELNLAADVRKLELLFELMKNEENGLLSVQRFCQLLSHYGLRKADPRLQDFFKKLLFYKQDVYLDSTADLLVLGSAHLTREQFIACVQENSELVCRAFEEEFIIPDFQGFCKIINGMYTECRDNNGGKVADCIPQLARFDPKYWAISVCTVDGQRHSVGDYNVPFCLQSASKPLNYAIAHNEMSGTEVHSYIGQEPSGRSFNEISLDHRNKPHNPMVNSGAIVICSLLKTQLPIADRFEYVFNEYCRMAGSEYVGFSNSTFLSERDTADRNFALGYYMKENKVFPKEARLSDTLDLYFQFCSVEVIADSCAVIAATLANGGICPLSGERILNADAVRNTLSLMHSCGMNDYSGQFAFKVGLPAKSGISGVIMLVVPNVMGICTWSPPVDEFGNSVRGIQFSEEFVRVFNFHNYDNLRYTLRKFDPRRHAVHNQPNEVVNLLNSAANGNVFALRRLYLQGMDVSQCDYDGRTALHLGAAEGHTTVVKFLLEKCHVNPTPKDRWNRTPLEEAIKFHRKEVVEYLQQYAVTSEER